MSCYATVLLYFPDHFSLLPQTFDWGWLKPRENHVSQLLSDIILTIHSARMPIHGPLLIELDLSLEKIFIYLISFYDTVS